MKKIGFALQIISIPVFLSSFFVTDNKKAVKRRYTSLAMFGAGWGMELLNRGATSSKSSK